MRILVATIATVVLILSCISIYRNLTQVREVKPLIIQEGFRCTEAQWKEIMEISREMERKEKAKLVD
jgi:hypothetical protein